jgi:hypothetical protein
MTKKKRRYESCVFDGRIIQRAIPREFDPARLFSALKCVERAVKATGCDNSHRDPPP